MMWRKAERKSTKRVGSNRAVRHQRGSKEANGNKAQGQEKNISKDERGKALV